MSVAGGFCRAVQRAADVGCDVVQIFTKNNNQWRAAAIRDEDAAEFRAALRRDGISHPIARSSYLINLASPDRALWEKSVEALVIELQRAEQLGLAHVVVHPGSFTTASEADGLRLVIRALDRVQRETAHLAATVLLENTAGQGSNLGWRFEQLAVLLDGVRQPQRVGVCFDTCHAFAAGYPLAGESDYQQTMEQLDRLVGLERIKAIHLNDSKGDLGSRKDRHEHIGKGHIGLDGFRHVMNDPRLAGLPGVLETPKGEDLREDKENLATLRSLCE